jgi:hypothetical protein
MDQQTLQIDYSRLPAHCRGGLQRYIEHGIEPGSFLKAILTNNLVEAFCRADDINLPRISDYARFLYWECPSIVWGSEEKVEEWISHKGLSGLQKEQPDD